MKTEIYILIFVLFLQVACSKPVNEHGSIDICQVNKETVGPNNLVRVSGELRGFHQFYIYDQVCPDNLIQVDLSTEQRSELISAMHQIGSRKSEVSGTIVVSGNLMFEQGYLTEYPPQIFHPASNEKPRTGLVVNKLIDVKVEKFVPSIQAK